SSSSIGSGLLITRSLQFRPVVKGVKNGVMTLRCNDPKDSVKLLTVHGFAYAVNEIHVGSVSARSGHPGMLTLSVNNMEQFSALQCEILLPSSMKYFYGSAVFIGRNVDHSISADTISGNILQIVCYSPTNTPFLGNDGDVAELQFEIDGQGGTYPLPVTQAIIADSTGKNILSASYEGQLRIASPQIQLTTSTLSLGSVSIFDTARATLQIGNIGDDTLKVSTATMTDPSYAIETVLPICVPPASSELLNIRFHNGTRGTFSTPMTLVHNDVSHNPSHVTTTALTFIPNTLKVVSTVGSPLDTVSVSLALDNGEPITALQCDLHVPAGAIFIPGSLVTSSRSSTHSLSSSVLSNGALRVIMFSLTQATFTGSTGDVARFQIVLPATEGSTEITLDNVIISNTANQNVVSSTVDGNVDTYIACAKGSCLPSAGVASRFFLAPTDLHVVADITASAQICSSFFARSPRSSSLPSGVQTVSAYFWNFTDKGVVFTNGALDISLSSLAGVSNASSLVWLKRENPDEAWTNLGGSVVDGRLVSVVPFSSFSEFAIGATTTDNPLPVEISDFNLAHERGAVVLTWTTSSELENNGFEIDRKLVAGQQVLGISGSVDQNSQWRQVGFLKGNGTSNVRHNYLFKDAVSPGEYCYRLKQIDRDGTIRYENQIETTVQLEEGDYGLKQNYPNPFNPATTFEFALKSTGQVDLSVYNSLGQKVRTLFNGNAKGGISYSLSFDAKDLASGTYFYVLRANGVSEVRKFLLLK
ncbi:MAG: T9SS type A sorting domain-containing protein, partial [Bacteroidota bacterium]